jgi:DNA repair ATPase RecN
MAEEKKERWLNYLALTTVILAVCATLSTFKGGVYSTRSVLAQAQASDYWAYYQSKSIKGYLYDIQREKLELELKEGRHRFSASIIGEYEKKIDAYSQKIKKYEEEKAKIDKDARAQEKVRNESQKHSQISGMAIIFLQIAILLSSISALVKKKPIWIFGLLVGIAGIYYFINGFLT